MKRGPYKPKSPALRRSSKARRIVPLQPKLTEEPDSEPNFVTALVKALVQEKLRSIARGNGPL